MSQPHNNSTQVRSRTAITRQALEQELGLAYTFVPESQAIVARRFLDNLLDDGPESQPAGFRRTRVCRAARVGHEPTRSRRQRRGGSSASDISRKHRGRTT